MQKFIEVDPKIKQIQKNIAFAVNNCEDCAVDTSFDESGSHLAERFNYNAPDTLNHLP